VKGRKQSLRRFNKVLRWGQRSLVNKTCGLTGEDEEQTFWLCRTKERLAMLALMADGLASGDFSLL